MAAGFSSGSASLLQQQGSGRAAPMMGEALGFFHVLRLRLLESQGVEGCAKPRRTVASRGEGAFNLNPHRPVQYSGDFFLSQASRRDGSEV